MRFEKPSQLASGFLYFQEFRGKTWARLPNEAAQALQHKFQDDGSLMILSKQSKLTKVCLSAPEEKKSQKNCGDVAGQPFLLISVNHFKNLSYSGHLCKSKLTQK